MLAKVIPGVLFTKSPSVPAIPLVLDSPHSGNLYPSDFDYVAPEPCMRRAEDMFVDEIFERAPAFGASFQAALYPRSYIDPNRALDDLDPDLLAEPWPQPLRPGEKTRLGHGLIWRICPPDYRMYDRRLRLDEVRRRIDNYWLPYHRTLKKVLDQAHACFGSVWHINCHSMPAISTPGGRQFKNGRGADFVLGDRDGTTCEPAFIDLVRDVLSELGYNVALNDPYKGVELVRAHADPLRGRHSLQIEINRALYMDEDRFAKNEGFLPLQRHLDELMQAVADYVASRSLRASA